METPSYYSVIPSSVRYDSRLSSSEKLMYGEITALSQYTGECWASNAYFTKLYNVSDESVRRWLKSLSECGYIKVSLKYKKGTKQVEKRIIKLLDPEMAKPLRGKKKQESDPPQENVSTPPQENVSTPPHKNVRYNNTSRNTTSRNISRDKSLDEIADNSFVALAKQLADQPALDGECGADRLTRLFFEVATLLRSGSRRLNPMHIRDGIVKAMLDDLPEDEIERAIADLFSKDNVDKGQYAVRVHKAVQFTTDKINQLLMKVDEVAPTSSASAGGIEGAGTRI